MSREIIKFRRGRKGSPWYMLDFSNGTGFAIAGDPESFKAVQDADRDEQKLDSPDILAIKGLGQFKKFKAVSAFRRFIEDWHVSDFHIEDARMTKDAGYSEQLSTTGDNLSNRKFRTPDRLGNPKEELKRLVKEYQQISGAKEIALHMEVEKNYSYSFKVFIDGIKKILIEEN